MLENVFVHLMMSLFLIRACLELTRMHGVIFISTSKGITQGFQSAGITACAF